MPPSSPSRLSSQLVPNFLSLRARCLLAIRALSAERPNMPVSQVSQITGLPRAAVRRYLYTLCKMEFVDSLEGGMFGLRPRVLLLGHGYFASSSPRQAAEPILNRLSGPLDESSSVSVLDGDDILYIARAQTKRSEENTSELQSIMRTSYA